MGEVVKIERSVLDALQRGIRDLSVSALEDGDMELHEALSPLDELAHSASASREGQAVEKALGSLLAVIHRDGGHYQTQHGTLGAIEDAQTKWEELATERCKLEAQIDRSGRLAHPWYGPCDAMAEGGACAECERVEQARSQAQVRHIKGGGQYQIEGAAKLKTDMPLSEGAALVVYSGPDGRWWARPIAEFESRFTPLTPQATP